MIGLVTKMYMYHKMEVVLVRVPYATGHGIINIFSSLIVVKDLWLTT